MSSREQRTEIGGVLLGLETDFYGKPRLHSLLTTSMCKDSAVQVGLSKSFVSSFAGPYNEGFSIWGID